MKIFLFYGHVASNIGDLAINSGVCHLLGSIIHNFELNVVFLDSEKSKFLKKAKKSFRDHHDNVNFINFRSHGSKAVKFIFNPESFLEEVGAKEADLILLNAGEHLFCYQEVDNRKSFFWRTLPAYAAKADNKKCVVLPSTFGPYETDESKRVISSLIEVSDAAAFREPFSKNVLNEIEPSHLMPVVLDPAFFIDTPLHAEPVHGENKAIGIILRDERWGIRVPKDKKINSTSDFDELEYRESISYRFSLELCREILKSAECEIKIIIQTEADKEISKCLQRELLSDELNNGRVKICQPVSVETYVDELKSVDRVVASRFHAIILGLIANKPVHAVFFESHGHKMPGLFNILEAQDFCTKLTNGNVGDAIKNIIASIEKEKDVFIEITNRIDQNKKNTIDWFKKAIEVKKDVKSGSLLGLCMSSAKCRAAASSVTSPTCTDDTATNSSSPASKKLCCAVVRPGSGPPAPAAAADSGTRRAPPAPAPSPGKRRPMPRPDP